MEILQTIWNALITENVMLIRILSIPMTLLEITVTTLLFTTILNIESSNKQKLTYILSFSLVAVILMYFVPTPYNTFLNVLVCPILVYFIFKTSILKSILAEIVPYSFFIVIGAIVGNLYTIIVKVSNQAFNTIPIHKILGSIFIYTSIYLIYKLIKYYKINIKNVELNKKNSRIINY